VDGVYSFFRKMPKHCAASATIDQHELKSPFVGE